MRRRPPHPRQNRPPRARRRRGQDEEFGESWRGPTENRPRGFERGKGRAHSRPFGDERRMAERGRLTYRFRPEMIRTTLATAWSAGSVPGGSGDLFVFMFFTSPQRLDAI